MGNYHGSLLGEGAAAMPCPYPTYPINQEGLILPVHQLAIEKKHRRHIGFVARLEDFTVTRQGEVDASVVVDNPAVTLYCLDDAARQAVFVELPKDVDLSREPFVYLTQYELAQRLFTMLYDTFNEVAESLPHVTRPIFLHITGRSGSTLLSHAFNQSGLVKSLAEPDVVSQFSNLRHHADASRESELRELAHSAIRFLFKNDHAAGIEAHAVKLRNQAVPVLDLFQTTFPGGKSLFLYRDVVGFAASFQRIFRNADFPERQPFAAWRQDMGATLGADLSHVANYLGTIEQEITLAQQCALWWLAVMDWYLAQHELGIPVMAIDFSDLVGAREETLSAIFRYCGLSQEGVTRGLWAYARDAQEGTALARENPLEINQRGLSSDELRSVQAIIARHPKFGQPDFAVPTVEWK